MSNKFISGNFADNGSSSPVEITKRGIAFIGSTGGTTFGSGTVVVQLQAPNGDWCTSSQSATSSDVLAIDVQLPTNVRLTLIGATAPDIDYAIQSDMVNVIE